MSEFVQPNLCPHCGGTPPLWTPIKIIEGIQLHVERHGSPPTREEWSHASYEHPTTETCDRVFGSLSRATLAAGYVPRARGGRQKSWPRERILDAIQRHARRNGGKPPTQKDWSRSTPEHPHFKTAQSEFGSWNAAIDEAGFYPRGKWGNIVRGKLPARENIGKADAAPVADALRVAVAGGASLRSLAVELDVDETYLGRIVRGVLPVMRADYADRILVKLDKPYLFKAAA